VNDTISAIATTPMMSQYLSIKENYPDALLFYRLGDFYELFFDDAVKAAKVLDIALTKRGKHEGADIAMCGVPHHASTHYINKLIKHGYKIAICEQLESPLEAKKRGYKAVVKREVVRVITGGTITEDSLLNAREANYLAAIVLVKQEQYGIAFLDLSTGEFFSSITTLQSIASDLAKINPKELLIADKLYDKLQEDSLLQEYAKKITTQVTSFFDFFKSQERIKSFYQVGALEGFGEFEPAEIAAIGAVLSYLSLTQKNHMPLLRFPKKIISQQFMTIDAQTAKNLELMQSTSGNFQNSVLHVLDQTNTSFGARLMRQYLCYPLIDAHLINQRFDKVDFFLKNNHKRQQLRLILAQIPDIERALMRINLSRCEPRDLLLLAQGLKQAQAIAELLANTLISKAHPIINLQALFTDIINTIKDDKVYFLKEGGFVKEKVHPKIDELVNINVITAEKIAALQLKYRQLSGVSNLKIQQNNLIGYYIEVSISNVNKIPEFFTLKQKTLNQARYTSIDLSAIEHEILHAQETLYQLELQVFQQLVEKIIQHSENIINVVQSLACVDVFSALGELAAQNNYTRPTIDNSDNFIVEEARHLVVEQVKQQGFYKENFVANDCNLSYEQRLWLITGPNMAGKSTFLRQNAIIAILAQMGSFIPARRALIGIIDRVFSRVGAADDLAKGRSTFMVEMVETATILNQATKKSLVILDEIGRGTATYDGLAIAWSCLEYIHDKILCRTLFATHYHELTSLADKLNSLKCYSMKVKEWQEQIIFLHKISQGSANNSYGIHVAKIAGLPLEVTLRAKGILQLLTHAKSNSSLPLFNKAINNNWQKKLEKINLAEITHAEAINLLTSIKEDVS
jgi:DNA mismatch repair protein MutS